MPLKKGNDTINFEARQFIRFVDMLSEGNSLNSWISLPEKGSGAITDKSIWRDPLSL